MSVNSPDMPAAPPAVERSRGRGYFWAGIAACLAGLVLVLVQLGLRQLFVPWYCPALATLGAFLLLVSVARRRTIPRIAALLLIAAFAGFQWYFLASLMKLPDYAAPVQAGDQVPTFRAAFANGRAFTDADLRDGSRRVMFFFRGR